MIFLIRSGYLFVLIVVSSFANASPDCKQYEFNVFKINDARVEAIIMAQMLIRGASDEEVAKKNAHVRHLSNDPNLIQEINQLMMLDLVADNVNLYMRSMKPDHVARLRREAKAALSSYRECIRMKTTIRY